MEHAEHTSPRSNPAHSEQPSGNAEVAPAPASKPKAKAKPRSSSIYVQGLPSDLNESQLLDFCKRGGLVKRDPNTGIYSVKIYRDESGNGKGDALVTYFKPESVPQAILLLDEAQITPGHVVRVREAEFDSSAKPKKKRAAGAGKKPKKARINQEHELGWGDDTRVHVIVQGMFDPSTIAPDDAALHYSELREDVMQECSTFGALKSVKVFEVISTCTFVFCFFFFAKKSAAQSSRRSGRCVPQPRCGSALH